MCGDEASSANPASFRMDLKSGFIRVPHLPAPHTPPGWGSLQAMAGEQLPVSLNPNSSTVVFTLPKAPREGSTQVSHKGAPCSPVAGLVPSLFLQPYLG